MNQLSVPDVSNNEVKPRVPKSSRSSNSNLPRQKILDLNPITDRD